MITMKGMEHLAEKVGALMKAETEFQGGRCYIKKKRSLEIRASKSCFICTLDLDISFRHVKEDGTALNVAEIYLLPEEFPTFVENLRNYPIPLPTNYSQRTAANPNLICIHMESKEPPEHFAERLSATLEVLEELGNQLYLNESI